MSVESQPHREQPTRPDGSLPGIAPWLETQFAENDDDAPQPGPAKFLAPPQSPDELGRLSGYRVLEVIGAGGMGMVLRAEDLLLHRPVALKIIRPAIARQTTARERFLREARAIAAVDHEHIVRIYAVGEDRGLSFIAMELLQGESLTDRLQRGPVPLPEVVRLGKELALGLQALHARGLVHRDVKPANIFLAEPGPAPLSGQQDAIGWARPKTKILDFGLVRATATAAELTKVGVSVGTPAYMAPEQADGKAVGPAADIFSLGCVLYRLCTQQLPFPGQDSLSILAAQARGLAATPRRLNPAVPGALSDLIVSMLATNPAARPTSADLVNALGALEKRLAELPTTKNWRLPVIAAALVVIMASAPLIWWMTRSGTNQQTILAKTEPPKVVELAVAANQAWTDSAIELQLGMDVEISASGVVDGAPAELMRPYFVQVPPEGRDERVPQMPQPTMPGLCLLGKVGTNVFYVGKQCRFTVDEARVGELQLGINDDLVDDNSGSWSVRVKLIPPRRATASVVAD